MIELDWDLKGCLENNPQSFVAEDIAEVLAVWEGENDGDDWRWVLRLNDNRFVFLQGGCDYTGWDCQSWATSEFTETAEQAADLALGDVKLGDSQPYEAGLGHMLSMLSGSYMANAEQIRQSLLKQIEEGRNRTRREIIGDDMPDLPKV